MKPQRASLRPARRTLKTAQERNEQIKERLYRVSSVLGTRYERELANDLRRSSESIRFATKIKQIRAQGGCHGTDCR